MTDNALIADLETRFALPVVTSNQATLWHALRTLRLDDRIEVAVLIQVFPEGMPGIG